MNSERREVVVVDVKIPFWSMVALLVKSAIAAKDDGIAVNTAALGHDQVAAKDYHAVVDNIAFVQYEILPESDLAPAIISTLGKDGCCHAQH